MLTTSGVFFVLGAVLNKIIPIFNGGKMPVLIPKKFDFHKYSGEYSNEHSLFEYSEKKKIRFLWLSDVIPFKTKRGLHMLSLGDILQYFGIAGIIITSLVMIYLY